MAPLLVSKALSMLGLWVCAGYLANRAVILPTFGDPVFNNRAVNDMSVLFPDRRVVPVCPSPHSLTVRCISPPARRIASACIRVRARKWLGVGARATLGGSVALNWPAESQSRDGGV